MKSNTRVVFAVAWLLAWAVSAGATPPMYSVTYMGSNIFPTDMNSKGEVVGYNGIFDATNYTYPVLWSAGKLINLGSLGGVDEYGETGRANAINDSGEIVGWSFAPGTVTHGFYFSAGKMNDLGLMGGVSSVAESINNHGQIVGEFWGQDLNAHVFLGTYGNTTDLGNLGLPYSGPQLDASIINDQTEIVGGFPGSSLGAFMYKNGQITYLGNNTVSVAAINSSGDIVGSFRGANAKRHACLYHNGVISDIDPTTSGDSGAYDINDLGQIVGGSPEHDAFLYTDGQMYNLNDYVDPKKYFVGLDGALLINNAGQIVANDGVSGGWVLLTPIPEPSTLILLAMFSLGLMGRLVKRRS